MSSRFLKMAVASAALFAGAASATNGVVPIVNGSAGGQVTIPVTVNATSTQGIAIDLFYDDSVVTIGAASVADCNIGGDTAAGAIPTCADNPDAGGNNDFYRATATNISGNLTEDGVVANLVLDIDAGAAVGDYFFSARISGPAACDGVCTINGAAVPFGAAATPAAIMGGLRISAGSEMSVAPTSDTILAATNSTSPTTTFTYSADGAVTGVTCSSSGDAEVIFTGTPSNLTAASSFDITGSCDTGTAGMFTATYTCMGTGDMSNPTSAAATLTCDVQDGLAVPAFVPGNNGTLTVGPVEPGGTGSSNIVFSETADAGTGYTIDSCTLDGGSAASFSLNGPTSGMVPAGGSFAIPVTATNPAIGDSGGITCLYTANGMQMTYSANLTVIVRALQVPTLSQWAMILMALALVGFGAYRLRKGGMAA